MAPVDPCGVCGVARRDHVKLVEWPSPGSAKTSPLGGWWWVLGNIGPGERGYSPVAGPFRSRWRAVQDTEKHEWVDEDADQSGF